VRHFRGSPRLTPDETEWKAGGPPWWMWDFSGKRLTMHSIQPGSGNEQVMAILVLNFDGVLVRDGWVVC